MFNIATIKDGKLVICLPSLMETSSKEDRALLSRYAMLQDGILDDLVHCIIHGETADRDWWWGDHLQTIRMKLVPLLPVLSQEIIEHERNLRERAEKDSAELRQKNWAMESELHRLKREASTYTTGEQR